MVFVLMLAVIVVLVVVDYNLNGKGAGPSRDQRDYHQEQMVDQKHRRIMRELEQNNVYNRGDSVFRGRNRNDKEL